jgi:hypothetical protein
MVKSKLKNLFLFYSVLLLCSTNNTFAVAPSHPTATGKITASGNVAVTCSVIASKQLRMSQENCMEFMGTR